MVCDIFVNNIRFVFDISYENLDPFGTPYLFVPEPPYIISPLSVFQKWTKQVVVRAVCWKIHPSRFTKSKTYRLISDFRIRTRRIHRSCVFVFENKNKTVLGKLTGSYFIFFINIPQNRLLQLSMLSWCSIILLAPYTF